MERLNELESLVGSITDLRLRRNIESIDSAIQQLWSPGIRIIKDFTDHSAIHSNRIAGYINKIIKLNPKNPLSERERFLLIAGIYLHDIGMQCDIVKYPCILDEAISLGAQNLGPFSAERASNYNDIEADAIRKNHHLITAAWIRCAKLNKLNFTNNSELDKVIRSIDNFYIDDIIDICRYHSKLNILECPCYFKYQEDKESRKRLVAALLRFGDELDIDSRRVSLEDLKLFRIPSQNRAHWILHSHTKVNINSETGGVTLLVSLLSEDMKSYGAIIENRFIDWFKEKNQVLLNLLVEGGFLIYFSPESRIIEDDYAEPLSPEVMAAMPERTPEKRIIIYSESRIIEDDYAESLSPEVMAAMPERTPEKRIIISSESRIIEDDYAEPLSPEVMAAMPERTPEKKIIKIEKKGKGRLETMKILVCLISGQNTANLLVVKTVKPDLLVLVVTPSMKGKDSQLLNALSVGGLDYSLKHEIIYLMEENSIGAVYDGLLEAFERNPEDEWIIMLTGGTKPMTVGAYEFSKNKGLKTLHIAEGNQGQAIDLLGGPSIDLTHNVSMVEFLAGQGLDLLNLGGLKKSEERAWSWIDLAALLAKHNKDADLRGFLGRIQLLKMAKIKLDRKDWEKNGFVLSEEDDVFLEDDALRTKIASKLGLSVAGSRLTGRLERHAAEFLTGKWLDIFIWSLLLPFANNGIWDLHLGAIVGLGGLGENHLDVSFMKNQSLFIVECRTGGQEHDPEAIDTLNKVEAIKASMKTLRTKTYLATTSDNVVDPKQGGIKENLQRISMILGCKIIAGWTIKDMADLYLSNYPGLSQKIADLFGIKTEAPS